MSNPAVANEVIELCAALVCHDAGPQISHIGVVFLEKPPRDRLDASSALQISSDALGIANWILTPVYKEALSRIKRVKVDVHAATACLIACPDFTTAWSVRKRCLAGEMRRLAADNEICLERGDRNFVHHTSPVARELAVCKLLMEVNPKSCQLWSHRAWVLDRFGWGGNPALLEELGVAERGSTMKKANYYAGLHRMLALQRITSPSLLLEQVQLSRRWLHTHVSDCSGWWFHMKAVESANSAGLSAADAQQELQFAQEMSQCYGEQYLSVRKYYKWVSIKLCECG